MRFLDATGPVNPRTATATLRSRVSTSTEVSALRDAGSGAVDCMGVQALRMPCSRHGWRRAARVGLFVLACAFASAGQSQEPGRLDDVVSELTLGLVNEADLRSKRVLVKSDDFFELRTELRLEFSEVLRGRVSTWLGRNGVPVAKDGSDEDEVMVLHGKWRRESPTVLNLELSVATPVKDGDPTALMTRYGRVLIDESIRRAIKSTIKDWMRLLVMRLDRNVRDRRPRIDVLIQPFTVKSGETARPEKLKEFLTKQLGEPLGRRRRFEVFEPVSGASGQVDGRLFGDILVLDEDVEVGLRVLDDAGRRVTFAKVELAKELFPSGIFGFGSEFRDCEECPAMVPVPLSYTMGSPSSEEGRDDDEGPVHRVAFAHPFAVGVHEVTRGEFARFVSATGHSTGDTCGTYEGGEWKWVSGRNWRNPGFEQTDEHPVVCVSHEDAKAYVAWLSRETGKEYRLPSESEWEYVARGGTGTARYWGEGEAGQCRHANGADKALKRRHADWPWRIASCDDGHAGTSPVGRFRANGFGLYDMLGNVWEWVEDCYHDSYEEAPSDGSAWTVRNCGRRGLRGGSWGDQPRYLRSANRGVGTTGLRLDYLGFRVARTLTP